MKNKLAVIGGGFAGLSAACFAARDGFDVTLYEKNESLGGRGRVMHNAGFVFDMGPSWYWMPDILEGFFNEFGKTTSDFYELVQLDPGFRVYFGNKETLDIPGKTAEIVSLFETVETGAGKELEKMLKESETKYRIAMDQYILKPGLKWTEYMRWSVLRSASKMHFFTSMQNYVRGKFRNPKLISILEFPVLFLGASAAGIPAMYSLMNHAAFTQGTFYPMGGMHKIVEAMETIARDLGVTIHCNAEVEGFDFKDNTIQSLRIQGKSIPSDIVISSNDYHHTDHKLLGPEYANYTETYWDSRTLAPSCLLYYIGLDKKVSHLEHHNLFFDSDFETHINEIYKNPAWPSNPLFYLCCPSKTDPTVAPHGQENLFFLVPLAPGISDSEAEREACFQKVLQRLEVELETNISDHIVYKKSYCIADFQKDYHAYKGNAYGLANTLRQTAVLKPKIISKKIKNLLYAGQLTVPGPGLPPSILSGKIASQLAVKKMLKV